MDFIRSKLINGKKKCIYMKNISKIYLKSVRKEKLDSLWIFLLFHLSKPLSKKTRTKSLLLEDDFEVGDFCVERKLF